MKMDKKFLVVFFLLVIINVSAMEMEEDAGINPYQSDSMVTSVAFSDNKTLAVSLTDFSDGEVRIRKLENNGS